MDEEQAVNNAYWLERRSEELKNGTHDDTCCMSTGQKLDVVYSIQHAMETLKELHEELANEVLNEMDDFLKENGYAIGSKEHDC